MSSKLSITTKFRNLFRKRSNSLPVNSLPVNTPIDVNTNNTKIIEYFSVDKNRFVETVVPHHVTILQEPTVYSELNDRNNKRQSTGYHEPSRYRDTSRFYDDYYSISEKSELFRDFDYVNNNFRSDDISVCSQTSSDNSIYSNDSISNYINHYFYYDEERDVYHCFQDVNYTRE